MSEKYIKLLGPVFHNNKEYNAEAILIIPENITEEEAERLIKFKTAEYFTPIVIKTNTAETGKQPPVNSNKDIPPSEMNKAQCQEELENLGIKYSKKATLGELQQLISDQRDSLQHKFKTAEYFTPIVIKTNTAETGKQPPVNSNKDIPPSEMNKAQCQEELENLGIKYSKKATLGELQQLISDQRDSLQQKLEDKEEGEKGGEGEEGKDINSMTREQLESELTVRAISFNSDQSDDDLRKLLTDYEAETGGNDE